MSNLVLILGARSDVGLALANIYAKNGFELQLASRNSKNLITHKSNLQIKYNVNIELLEFDVLDIKNHTKFVNNLKRLPSIVICVVGLLGDQKKSEIDTTSMIKTIRTNYEGPVNILSIIANKFENRKSGTIVCLSSVAGERGRASNYFYGSAKSGLTSFLSGLRNRMHSKGVNIITVIPGYIRTRMIANLKTPDFLTSEADEIAARIYYAVLKKKDVIYEKKRWFLIMLIIKSIPELFFKRLNL